MKNQIYDELLDRVTLGQTKQLCVFGTDCYRYQRNQEHASEFSHISDTELQAILSIEKNRFLYNFNELLEKITNLINEVVTHGELDDDFYTAVENLETFIGLLLPKIKENLFFIADKKLIHDLEFDIVKISESLTEMYHLQTGDILSMPEDGWFHKYIEIPLRRIIDIKSKQAKAAASPLSHYKKRRTLTARSSSRGAAAAARSHSRGAAAAARSHSRGAAAAARSPSRKKKGSTRTPRKSKVGSPSRGAAAAARSPSRKETKKRKRSPSPSRRKTRKKKRTAKKALQ